MCLFLAIIFCVTFPLCNHIGMRSQLHHGILARHVDGSGCYSKRRQSQCDRVLHGRRLDGPSSEPSDSLLEPPDFRYLDHVLLRWVIAADGEAGGDGLVIRTSLRLCGRGGIHGVDLQHSHADGGVGVCSVERSQHSECGNV